MTETTDKYVDMCVEVLQGDQHNAFVLTIHDHVIVTFAGRCQALTG